MKHTGLQFIQYIVHLFQLPGGKAEDVQVLDCGSKPISPSSIKECLIGVRSKLFWRARINPLTNLLLFYFTIIIWLRSTSRSTSPTWLSFFSSEKLIKRFTHVLWSWYFETGKLWPRNALGRHRGHCSALHPHRCFPKARIRIPCANRTSCRLRHRLALLLQ